MSPDGTYNGYQNYQTWNVCLWISNDEMLNGLADQCGSYEHFKLLLRDVFETHPVRYETPEGVSWNDSGINMAEMKSIGKKIFLKFALDKCR